MPNNKARGLKMENENLDNLDLNNADHGDDAKQTNSAQNDKSEFKTALDKERAERRTWEKRAKDWARLNTTPDEVAQLLQEREEAERTKAEKAGEWDKLKAKMSEAHAKQLSEKENEIQKMRKTLEYNLISAQATSAIAAAKGSTDLLLPHVERFVKVIEDGEQFRAVVVDEKGDPRVNGKGENLTIAELIEEMKQSDKYARAFDGSGQSGSGMQPNKVSGGATPKRSQMTASEKADYQQKHGQDAFLLLPL